MHIQWPLPPAARAQCGAHSGRRGTGSRKAVEFWKLLASSQRARAKVARLERSVASEGIGEESRGRVVGSSTRESNLPLIAAVCCLEDRELRVVGKLTRDERIEAGCGRGPPRDPLSISFREDYA